MKTGKRILAVVLTATMCVSSLGTVAMTSASAARKLQNNLWMDKSITVGKNEKCYLYYDVNEGLSEHLKATSDNSNVKVLNYSQGANYGNALIEGRNVGTANVHVEGKKSSDGIYTYGDCKVTVKPAPTSVRLSITSLTLGVGETFTITESTNSGSYANADNLKWSTSNSNVAIPAKVSGSNKAVIRAKGIGTATITIKTYNGKTATCKVTIKNAPSDVNLSKTSLTLNKGKSYAIAESTNSGSYAKSFTWSSSNSKVATVTKDSGNKAIVKAVGKGTAYIKIKTYNGKTATCKVTVK